VRISVNVLVRNTEIASSSYVTIDWIHDAVSAFNTDTHGIDLAQIKESSRVRRLRYNASRSVRGAIINVWDRFQGWLVVSIIGPSLLGPLSGRS